MYHDRPVVVDVQQQTVLRHLLLHQQHLLRAAHDEVTARVVEALLHLGQLCRCLVAQNALGGVEHDGELPDAQVAFHHDLVAERVLDVDENGRGVGQAAFAALHGRNLFPHSPSASSPCC